MRRAQTPIARDRGAAQHLATGEKFRLLLEQILQKFDRVTEIAQLYRSNRFQPITAQLIAKIFFIFYRHVESLGILRQVARREQEFVQRQQCNFARFSILVATPFWK